MNLNFYYFFKYQTSKFMKFLFLLFFACLVPFLTVNVQASFIEYQGITITGTIVDNEGLPLPGVNVIQKGTMNGSVTDFDGKYSITVSAKGVILQYSFVGFVTIEQVVEDQIVINVTMIEQSRVIDEVVVIGYGTRQRKSVTGAIDQVGSHVFENRPVTNAMQALQGASPNLIIQQRNMNPNDNTMNINIRGISSMQNNDPLVIIDGLVSSTGTLNNMNPNDIETVTVLKDAGSAAIYGSRSANGVILVTTKMGVKGKPVVRFTGMYGIQVPQFLFEPVKGYENALLRNQGLMNVGMAPMYTPEFIRDLEEHQSEESWWLHENIKTAAQQSYNVNIAGGTDNTSYMISGGWQKQETNFIGDFWMQRFNFRTNLSTEWGRFKVTSQMAYTRRQERTVAGGTGSTIIDSSRLPAYYFYVQKEDGKYFLNDVDTELNPRAHLEKGGYEDKDEDNFLGNMNLEIKIIQGLKIKGLAGIDLTQHHRLRRFIQVPVYNLANREEPARYINNDRHTDDYNNKRYTLSTQLFLDFDRTFNSAHHVTGLLGATNESFTQKESNIGWFYTDVDLGLPNTDDREFDNGSYTSNDRTNMWSITSMIGRLGYDYLNRYYLDFSFRYDGSSKFHKDHRWGFFPSLSASWRISEESFMDFYKTNMGDLKIRTSYGVLGSQNGIGNYDYQTTYSTSANTYVFDNSAVAGAGFSYGNPLLTWEKSANFNIGLDASFFRNRLYLSLDYFDKKTSDILMSVIVPSTFGSSAPNQNKGKMQNRGWETTIGYRLNHGDFRHNFNFNIADQKNKVTDYGGNERIDNNDQLYKIVREGEALGSYFGYKTAGFFQSYEEIAESALPSGASVQPGDVKYVNQNPDIDDVINNDDRVVLGYAFPRYTFGFTYDVSWKGFDFSILAQGVGKRNQYVRGELMEPFHAGYSQVIYKHQLDFWTPVNPDARFPRLVAPGSASSTNNWGRAGTDIYLLNAAYLRLKNIQLGYTLPQQLTAKAGIQKLRISLNAQNLLTLTKNSFIDPESSEFGNNMGGLGGVGANSARNYPTLIYYGIGINLEF